MKPEFLKELEKRMGPVAAHRFMDEYFRKIAGSMQVDVRSLAVEQKRRAKREIRQQFLAQVVTQLKPSEDVKGSDIETFRWELYVPKEFAKNG